MKFAFCFNALLSTGCNLLYNDIACWSTGYNEVRKWLDLCSRGFALYANAENAVYFFEIINNLELYIA